MVCHYELIQNAVSIQCIVTSFGSASVFFDGLVRLRFTAPTNLRTCVDVGGGVRILSC